MPTYDYTNGAVSANTYTGAKLSVVERVLDFAQIAIDRAAAGQTALAAADILTLFGVAKGQFVLAVGADIEVVEGETATFGIGDGSGTSGYLAAVDANVLGTVAWSGVTSAYSVAVGGGKRYAAADTIDMILNTAAFNVAKIRVYAIVLDLRADQS